MAGDSHHEVACVAPGFSPAFPLFVAQAIVLPSQGHGTS